MISVLGWICTFGLGYAVGFSCDLSCLCCFLLVVLIAVC